MSLLKKLGMSLASFGLAFALNLESRLYARDIYVPSEYATTIQAAIDANDTKDGDTIFVAPGEYVIREPITFRGKRICVRALDPTEYDTIIRMSNPVNPSMSSVFIFENGETNNSILEGFVITMGGGCPVGGDAGISGGGILCKGASPTIQCNVISENGVGAFSPYGGMYGEGGGIYCVNSNARIFNNVINKNKSHRGGGIMCSKSNIMITNNQIFENSTDPDYGGGIGGENLEGIIKDNLIIKNATNAEGNGAGIAIIGGKVLIEKNLISYNGTFNPIMFPTPSKGGGIFIQNSPHSLILNNTIIGNSAISSGGGVYCNSDSKIIGNIISNNSTGQGAGIYVDGRTNPLILNNTIVANFAERGGGISDNEYEPSSPIIKSCIVYGNTLPEFTKNPETADLSGAERFNISYSLLSQPEYCGINGNICADPLFANLNNNDYHLKSQAGRWDPNKQEWVLDDVTSLCIDAGDPLSPIMYEPFPNGGRINMGAYGGTAEASKSYFGKPNCETIVAGDINGDCKVNFRDFAIMAYHWLENYRE